MNFIESPRIDHIFYGHIFRINGQGCLVFGSGKSIVCSRHTGLKTQQIGLDFACLTQKNGRLFGHFEMEQIFESFDPNENQIEISHFLRMLSEEETLKNKVTSPMVISIDAFIDLCEFNIEFSPMSILGSKVDKFRAIIEGQEIKCIAIPWCETVQARGEMIVGCLS